MRWLIEQALKKRVITYFITTLLFIGGAASFFSLGQLEDPPFSIKTAVVVTNYPGASPEEVELEVTDRLETAIQEMPQLKDMYSVSRAGNSYIRVDIKDQYWSAELPQIWDELRRKIGDAQKDLPPGAQESMVNDDFGFVYGFLLAITGDGFSNKELEDYAKIVQKELNLVNNIARVQLWGVQEKVIYLDISEKQLSEFRITPETFLYTMKNQNQVVNAGSVDNEQERFRIAPTGDFSNPSEIGELIISPHPSDIMTNAIHALKEKGNIENILTIMSKESEQFITLKDLATIRPGYREPPMTLMRYDGNPAIGIAIAGTEDSNIVSVGADLDQRIEEIMEKLPIGLQLHKIAWQSDLVEESVNGFLISLLQAIGIVILVLIIPSGLRMGLIIGIDLVLTILGTFIVMSIMDIALQRMSLGALIIALGMMVDNSIVVSDSIAVKIREGVDRTKAAVDAAMENAFPLFAATLVAVMTFYPIYASTASTGEYCASLFFVVATALLLSWAISLLLTPIKCVDMIPKPDPSTKSSTGEFQGPFFKMLRSILRAVIRVRFLTVAILGGMLVASILGFGFVTQLFFPDSSRPQLMVDIWTAEGTRIQDVAKNAAILEKEFISDDLVSSVSSFIGSGPPRFYLPVDSERQNQNYAQLIVNFNNFQDIDAFIAKYKSWVGDNVPDGMVRFRKYGVGPGDPWKFELRITGPGEADIESLRTLGNQIINIAESSPYGRDWRFDVMNPILKLVPEFNQKVGRLSLVSRPNMATATKRSYDGVQVGLYREGDSLYPIIARNTEYERDHLLLTFDNIQIRPDFATWTVPLAQVTTGLENKWEDSMIARWNRRREVAVQGEPAMGSTFPTLRSNVIDEIKKIKLPPGYELFWDGEYDSTKTSQDSLLPGLIPAGVIILLLLVLVFNEFKPVLIILMTIPFAIIGITCGLLVFNIPFGFMALLGGMSLVGMMNKNIIVLLDACNANYRDGLSRYDAIVEASVSRARPVFLAAGTTILGVVPLLPDIFWVAMAVTIMAGLAFGSLLTLICVPVFYSILYRLKKPGGES
ncbi:MAG: Multidrug export protein AcrF [Chlamydiae bacterium]|nr:Multidrug export protein AcrF [Chlamydiota bacterium]